MPDKNDVPNEKNMLLIEAYRIQVERWNKRRDIEWRLTLTLWSAILIATFTLAGKYQFTWYIGIVHLMLFVIYGIWIWNLWKRNACDKKQMYNYQKKINEKLGVRLNDVSEEGWKYWNIVSQLLFTFFILFCSLLILRFPPKLELSFLSILKWLIR